MKISSAPETKKLEWEFVDAYGKNITAHGNVDTWPTAKRLNKKPYFELKLGQEEDSRVFSDRIFWYWFRRQYPWDNIAGLHSPTEGLSRVKAPRLRSPNVLLRNYARVDKIWYTR